MFNTKIFGNKKIDLRKEMEQRQTRRLTMLQAFKTKGELTTHDINKFGTGCSSRLKELREEGHVIVTTYMQPGNYRYTYIGQKDDD